MHLLEVADKAIDTLVLDGPANRVSHELTEISDRLAIVEAFSHCWIVKTADGLVLFDASGAASGPKVVEQLRRWSTDRVHTIVYTHGHMDHVGGANAFLADAETRGYPRPRFVAHENVRPRLERYERTDGYNLAINQRQFAPGRKVGMGLGGRNRFVPPGTPRPDEEFRDTHELHIGDDRFLLTHGRGETDDHAWTEWVGHQTLFVGDFLIWNFPNCGNPQKVLRYPLEWAQSLRRMLTRDPKFVAPAHGLPPSSAARAEKVLGSVATALESLVEQVIDLLNNDARLEDAIHTVQVPETLMTYPWLRPMYDEPEFVVRNIWRTYGGWWDGNPSHLHPTRPETLAAEVVALAGGVDPLLVRAESLAAAEDFRTACELIEFAVKAEPDNIRAHTVRADVYSRRRFAALSLMAKGIYLATALESATVAGVEVPGSPRGSSLN